MYAHFFANFNTQNYILDDYSTIIGTNSMPKLQVNDFMNNPNFINSTLTIFL